MNNIINYENLPFKSRIQDSYVQPIPRIQGHQKENVQNITPIRTCSQQKIIQNINQNNQFYTSIENNNLNHSGIRQQVLKPVNSINVKQQQMQRGILNDQLSMSPYSNFKRCDTQDNGNKSNQISSKSNQQFESQQEKRLELLTQENQRLNLIIKNQLEENEKLKIEIKNIHAVNSEKTMEKLRNMDDMMNNKNQEINYLKNEIYQNEIQQKQLQETADKYKEAFEKIESRILDVIQENDKLSEIIKQKDIYCENLQQNLNIYIEEYNKLNQHPNISVLQEQYNNLLQQYQFETTEKQNKINQYEEFLQKYQNFEDLEQKTNQVIQENDKMVEALNDAKQTIEQQQQQYFQLQQNMINMDQKQIKLIETLQQYKQLCQQIQEQANWGIEFEDEQL